MMANHKTISDLTCGAVAGAVSQTASYPFEVIRRRMQVGGVKGGTGSLSWKDAVLRIWTEGKGKMGRGFYTGITIGWLKVVPMTRSVHITLRCYSFFLIQYVQFVICNVAMVQATHGDLDHALAHN